MRDANEPPMSSDDSTNIHDLNPMEKQQAAGLTARLLRGYPYLNLADPQGYATTLVEILIGYPHWVGVRAIRRIDDDNPNFPPSDRMLRKWCEEIFAPARFAALWRRRAREQIADRKCLPRPQRPTYEEIASEMCARGLPMRGGKPAQARGDASACMAAKLGLTKEQWEALPDAAKHKTTTLADALPTVERP